jgi:6-phosphogluconolactonase (cycloisomerase 2 family)
MPPDSRSQNVFGWAKGLVSAFAMTTTPLRLRAINMQAAMGSITACSSFDATGRFLLAANYGMGVAEDEGPGQSVVVFPLPAGGWSGACRLQHRASGQRTERRYDAATGSFKRSTRIVPYLWPLLQAQSSDDTG